MLHQLLDRAGQGLVTLTLFITLLLTAGQAQPVHAAAFCVNPTGSGGCLKTIQAAEIAAASGDTINIAVGTYSPLSGEVFPILISKTLTLNGGPGGKPVVDAGHTNQVFRIVGGKTVTLSGLVITNGHAHGSFPANAGGGIEINSLTNLVLKNVTLTGNTSDAEGGGIAEEGGGSVTLTNSRIINNTATTNGGGIAEEGGGSVKLTRVVIDHNQANPPNSMVGDGGGISMDGGGNLTVDRSTLSNNAVIPGGLTPNHANGGAIAEEGGGKVTITRSAIVSNTVQFASGQGGGLAAEGGGAITLANVTFSGDTAPQGGGAIEDDSDNISVNSVTIAANSTGIFLGGGKLATNKITVLNTIVANSTAGANCLGPGPITIVSNGHNLSSDTSCPFSLVTDMNNKNPKLGALGKNGGSTLTMPLLSASPAIDAGPTSGCPATDQRGQPRPDAEDHTDGKGCDIGAFENQSAP